jgi:hypothetical protein
VLLNFVKYFIVVQMIGPIKMNGKIGGEYWFCGLSVLGPMYMNGFLLGQPLDAVFRFIIELICCKRATISSQDCNIPFAIDTIASPTSPEGGPSGVMPDSGPLDRVRIGV